MPLLIIILIPEIQLLKCGLRGQKLCFVREKIKLIFIKCFLYDNFY